jgi:hypothetical protein
MIGAAIILCVFFFLGGYLLLSNLSKLSFSKEVSKWPKEDGAIKEVYAKDWYPLDATHDKEDPIKLRYYYSYRGKEYHNIVLGTDYSVWLSKTSTSNGIVVKDIPDLIQRLKENPKVTVWVNPENPKDSFLLLNQKSNVFLSCMGVCLIIWAIVIGFFISNVKVLNIADKVVVKEFKTEEEMDALEELESEENNTIDTSNSEPSYTISDSSTIDTNLLR